MSYEDTAGLGVFNQYGARGTQDGVVGGGKMATAGAIEELVVYITGDDFDGAVEFDTLFTLPAGAVALEAICEVTTAFTLGNADNDIYVGTKGSEDTNYGMQILNPAAATTTIDAPGGTWAAPLAAATAVSVLVDGTTPSATGGEAKVVIRYQKI
jgi:hypothetical protein